MSVSDQVVRQSFDCNGSVKDFSFAHPFKEISDLDVWHISAAGTPTPLDHVTDYNYDLPTGDPMDGCTITTVATYATDEKILVIRDIPYTQPTNWATYSKFMPSQINSDLDRMAMEIQQLKEKLDRVPMLHVASAINGIEIDEPVENYFLLWKSGALRSRQFLQPGNLSFEAFMETFLEANTKALARAAIEAADAAHNHNLADLAEKNYSSLVTPPADDDFQSLTEETSIHNDDWVLIYDLSASAYRKIKRSNVVAGAPAGTILLSGCPSISPPAGTLFCDGSSLLRTTYATLFAAIGTAFGTADGTHFNIPDHRGRFIRLVDHGQARDPDAATRDPMAAGGNPGDAVGSVQLDAFQGHKHEEAYDMCSGTGGIDGFQWKTYGAGWNINTKEAIVSTYGTPRLSEETRAINAYLEAFIVY